MATVLKQCHDCGAKFLTLRDLDSHRVQAHNWRPVVSKDWTRHSPKQNRTAFQRSVAAVFLSVVAFAFSVAAEGLDIVAPESTLQDTAVIDIEATTSASDVQWHVWPVEARNLFRSYRHVSAPLDDQPTQPRFLATISRPPEGKIYLVATAVVDGRVVSDEHEILCGIGPEPTPTPEPPPPNPPSPEPKSPINWPGLAVLIVYESADVSKMPRPQFAAIAGQELRNRLSKSCAKNEQRQPMWRVHDQHVDLTNELPVWREAMARPRASIPWIVIGNGKTGYEGPLPADTESISALVAKYAEGN